MNDLFRVALLGGCLALLPCIAIADQTSSVLGQVQGVPEDFHDWFFDVPLAVKVELDGRFLGDALIMLGRDEHLRLVSFTDTRDSAYGPAEQARWQQVLEAGWPLGACSKVCPNELVALHYSLATSQVSILTRRAEHDPVTSRFHQLPERGSYGLLLGNQLNLTGGQASDTAGRYAFQGQASLGLWTAVAGGQVHRSAEISSAEPTRYYAQDLYAERLARDRFWRIGLFTPDESGILRAPRLLGSRPDTTLGLMYGSSDSLAIDTGMPSATPIHVTPSRPAVAEIYRNGVLINSQPVQPGLQTLDTRRLPSGIYPVEVRVVEDGQVTSRTEEFVYKPGNWSNPDEPLRYNLYLGQRSNALSNWDDDQGGELNAGVIANYLMHPRAMVGASVQTQGQMRQYGLALDWTATDDLQLYGSLFHTQAMGNGFDLQSIYRYGSGSLVLSHSRSWLDTERFDPDQQRYRQGIQRLEQTALSGHHRLTREDSLTMRLSNSRGGFSGTGADLGWSRNGKLAGTDANWRLSVFDRPGTLSTGNSRNRGFDLSLSVLLGQDGKRVSGSFGSRTSRDGGRDQNASLTYQQGFTEGPVQNLVGNLTADRYGAGLGGLVGYGGEHFNGDLYAQRSSADGDWSGGLNLDSTLALGAGNLAAVGQSSRLQAGLIIDVDSDEPVQLRSDDFNGQASILHKGRNLIPVTPYQAGSVQFDFAGSQDPAAVVQPTAIDYHLNRGGVGYQQIRVMKTVTVIGRLLDAHGQPVGGALLINHASRGVSEADGFFAVEMSQATPQLEVRLRDRTLCLLDLTEGDYRREAQILMAGELSCVNPGLATTAATDPRRS